MQDALLEGPIGHSVVSLTDVVTAFLWDTPAAQPLAFLRSVVSRTARSLLSLVRT